MPGLSAALPGPLQFLSRLVEEQGDRVRYQSTYGEIFYFNDPEDVRTILQSQNFVRTPLLTVLLGQGLLASDGPHWKSQRKLMQPAFREPCTHAFLPVVSRCTTVQLQHWETQAADASVLDISAQMRQLSLDIILQCLFSTSLGSDLAKVDRAVTALVEDLGLLAGTFFNQAYTFPPNRNVLFKAALGELDSLVQGIILQSREHASANPDSHNLQSLLNQGTDSTTGAPLSDKQIRDEIVTMILGGHETTAVILAWTWHLLATHPQAEAALWHELDETLQGRPPTYSDLASLPFTRRVFQEAMRLYPPVWFMMRRSLAATTVGGLDIPAGGSVLISPYTTHRHPAHWSEPLAFRPERFEEDPESRRHKYAFLPFSAGRHQCLGMGFAMLEGPLILAALAQRFQVIPSSPLPVEMAPLLTLRQQGGLPGRVVRRTSLPFPDLA
ncbi:MAG: cytochrome P450 [Verrucomicrobium sp.]